SGKKCPDIMITKGNWNNFVSGAKGFAGQGVEVEKPVEETKPVEPINPNEVNPASPNIKLTINGYGVNVRSGAGTNFPSVDKLNAGREFKVLAIKDGWYEIEKGKWVKYDPSYIKLTYNAYDQNTQKPDPKPEVKPDPKPEVKPEQTSKKVQVNGDGVRIRSGAGQNFGINGKAVRGKTYDVLEEKNGWVRIDGGWIYNDSSYIKTITSGGGNSNQGGNTGGNTNTGGNQVQSGKKIKVNGNGVRIRSGAGQNYGVSGYASYGQEFDVQVESNGWLKTSKGWIYNDSSYIQTIGQGGGNSNSNNNNVQQGKKIQVNGDGVRIRSGAGQNYGISGYASKGKTYTVQAESNGWVKVDGGWIYNDSSYIRSL
ncbi:SH3 domain-containing protein, partial [Bacillus cereus]|uniref:SH3 domain-containing protein n=1 Tax=Bacillus cereus TaxID=1396 RepID=UPI003D16905C